MSHTQNSRLGLLSLSLISVSAIVSLRNFAVMALQGRSNIVLCLMAGLFFLIPSGLVSAELATKWPRDGGIYVWVTQALGARWGVLAIWFAWITSLVWFPVALSFLASAVAMLIDPSWVHHKPFLVSVMIGTMMVATWLNEQEYSNAAWISTVGTLVGTLIPGLLLGILGLHHAWTVGTAQLSGGWLPDWNDWSLMAATLVSFAGIEVTAYSVQHSDNPERDFPTSLAIAALIVVLLSIWGALSIALVVPPTELSLVAGLFQAFTAFFQGNSAAVTLLAWMMFIGTFAQINTWIMGPARGLLVAAQWGYLPPILSTVNRAGSPVAILRLQCALASILALTFYGLPQLNQSYWLLMTMTGELMAVMYLLMFVAALVLRSRYPNRLGFSVPGGLMGLWLCSLVGIGVCVFVLIIGFLPPADIHLADFWKYLAAGLTILIAPGMYLAWWRPKSEAWLSE